ncbi:amino acid permease/ SLC12A domain-containing protein [Diplogelasinospora grovesii]|uniref:Amino acid permease/ SLC12A domain-containing protein n=1 Tax=Diplogelasinospora grovesii TaxID=303347 RepID=A0AAN6N320_9PEZI|nr:amino acid permease/ SLC12A domain-containing protein [Diplogelasinospora grovesii]
MSKAEAGLGGSITPEKTVSPSTEVPPAHREEDWWTRNGLNFRSFQKRDHGTGSVELDRDMKTRHLHMIAIGGSIGAGFFVGSGKALASGGPATLLIDFLIIGVMMFNTVYALGELAVMFPVSGGFYTYSTRFIDPSWGFAMGWNYCMQWAVVLPLELTVCGLTIQYWNPDISVAVWISVFLGAIIIVNIFGTLGYAEEEFWSSVLKLGATIVFMIIAFVLVLGGGPAGGRYGDYWGARLWYEPGAFANGFRGFCSVFVTAAFAFSGTELVGLAAAETRNPVKSLPGAIKQVFWRITLFYVLGLFFVGLLISSDDPALLGAKTAYIDVNTSPFVLVGKYAGLAGFDSFMNVVILVSVLSIGVSAVYGGSRTLTALAQQGYAPQIFTYIDRSGRPLWSVAIIIAFGLLGYLNLTASGPDIFDWLLALSGLAALFTWGSICLAHIRFRSAWAYHGHSVDEIPFKAVGGVYGSYLGLVLIVLVLIAQFYVAICPVGGGYNDVQGFFKSYLALPVVIFFYIVGRLWKGKGWLKPEEINVDEGRRELPWEEIHEYRAQLAAMPAWRRMIHTVFI